MYGHLSSELPEGVLRISEVVSELYKRTMRDDHAFTPEF